MGDINKKYHDEEWVVPLHDVNRQGGNRGIHKDLRRIQDAVRYGLPAVESVKEIERFMSINLGNEGREKIAYRNARSLLKEANKK